ncbi:MAG TPA: GNAT family N-acetyltransferase [Microbacterium sp.]|nr:GNAT family N-acetyltransferase [Microbacterium sp.]
MDVEALTLVELRPRPKGRYWRVFAHSSEFPAPWWDEEHRVDDSDHWISARRDGVEVARCKFVLDARPLDDTPLGPMPHGQLDILAFEVAVSARRQGIGRATLQAIRKLYPAPRLTALNDDEVSRRFWDGIGWVRHQPTNPFSEDVERVAYSEP